MEHYAGIDVSLELSRVCVVDAAGRIVHEAKLASGPEALIAWFRGLGTRLARIGLGSRHRRERAVVAVAVRRDARRRSCRGAARDPSRARRVRGDAGEDGSQGRPRHCTADAAGPVPPRALQVAAGALKGTDGLGAMWRRGRTALLHWPHPVRIGRALLVLPTAKAE